MHKNVVSGLIRRRRELALEASTILNGREELFADVATLDRAILIFRPDFDRSAIRPLKFAKKPHWAHRGALTRAIIDVLRMADEPLPTPEMIRRVLDALSLPTDDNNVRAATSRYRKTLTRLRARKLIMSRKIDGGPWVGWALVR